MPTPQPEQALLLRLTDPRHSALEPAELPAGVDWGVFLEAAYQHRVAALAGATLARSIDPDSAREYVLDALTAAATLNAHRNGVLLGEAVTLVGELADRGVRAALRKGCYLTPAVYGANHLRPMSDIDLFVDRADAPRVSRLLEESGYVAGSRNALGAVIPLTRRERVFWRVHVNNLPAYHRGRTDPWLPTVAVDTCFGIFLPASGARLDPRRALDESRAFTIAGRPAYAFRAEHMLLDVAAHLYKESTTLRYIERGKHRRLLQYVDVAMLVRHEAELDWADLAGEAARAGALRPLYFALANTEALFPATMPDGFLAELAERAGVSDGFLREYGEIDLDRPLTWSARHIAERLFSSERPGAVSQSAV